MLNDEITTELRVIKNLEFKESFTINERKKKNSSKMFLHKELLIEAFDSFIVNCLSCLLLIVITNQLQSPNTDIYLG